MIMQRIIDISDHAKERAWSRFNMSPNRLADIAMLALTKGFSVNDAPTPAIKNWIMQKSKYEDRKIYCFMGYCFILKETNNGMCLITALEIPKAIQNPI